MVEQARIANHITQVILCGGMMTTNKPPTTPPPHPHTPHTPPPTHRPLPTITDVKLTTLITATTPTLLEEEEQ